MKRLKVFLFTIMVVSLGSFSFAEGADAQFYFDRGSTFFNEGQFDKAIKDFSEALSQNPTITEAYYNRGQAYYKKGQYENAIADFNKVIEVFPQIVANLRKLSPYWDNERNAPRAEALDLVR